MYDFCIVPKEGPFDLGLERGLVDRRVAFFKLRLVSLRLITRLGHADINALGVPLRYFDARTSDHIGHLKSLVDALIGDFARPISELVR